MTIVWSAWLIVLVLSFAAFEFYALYTNRTSLSRYVWNMTQAWPPFGWVAGVITGGLAMHFFWVCQGCPLPAVAAALTLFGG